MDTSVMTRIARDVDLSAYSTMRLGGKAAFAVAVTSREDLIQALSWAKARHLPAIMVGSGSNIVWRDEGFGGLLMINHIKGRKLERNANSEAVLTLGAGENWDEAVAYSVDQGLTGIECLSLIPGTCGATPVQNVGAYGQEIADTLIDLEAYDSQAGRHVTIANDECGFGYRTSRFKAADRGRYFITAIRLRLKPGQLQPPLYRVLQAYFDEHGINDRSPQTVRRAVIAIRSAKLPDPRHIANNGSFFANPIIAAAEYQRLAQDYPDMPHWPAHDDRIKLSAAWLIEQAGFKDYHDSATGMATWAGQPLVLVNESAHTSNDLLTFRQKIVTAIGAKFGIVLEQEPELLPDLGVELHTVSLGKG